MKPGANAAAAPRQVAARRDRIVGPVWKHAIDATSTQVLALQIGVASLRVTSMALEGNLAVFPHRLRAAVLLLWRTMCRACMKMHCFLGQCVQRRQLQLDCCCCCCLLVSYMPLATIYICTQLMHKGQGSW